MHHLSPSTTFYNITLYTHHYSLIWDNTAVDEFLMAGRRPNAKHSFAAHGITGFAPELQGDTSSSSYCHHCLSIRPCQLTFARVCNLPMARILIQKHGWQHKHQHHQNLTRQVCIQELGTAGDPQFIGYSYSGLRFEGNMF